MIAAAAMEENSNCIEGIQVLTHLLTSPLSQPFAPFHLFVSTRFPCYLGWDFPPFLCDKQVGAGHLPVHLRWAFSLFLKRVSRFGFPETSRRSKCSFQQPPPLIIAAGVEPAPLRMGVQERREYWRKRLRRKRLVSNVNPMIPVVVPNVLLFLLLFWNPLSLRANLSK